MKSSVVALLVVVLLAVGGFFVWQSMDNEDEDTPSTTTTQNSNTEDSSAIDQAEETVDEANAQTVEISNFAYSPANLSVKKGTTVTWTNKDSVTHTVTSDDASGPLNSGDIESDETFSFTFSEVGTFAYHCAPHPQMKGTVTVTE